MHLSMPEKNSASARFRPLARPGLCILAALVLAAAGYAYWQFSGRLTLEGRLQSAAIRILAGRSGIVAGIGAVQGQRAQKGDALLRFDDAPLRRALADEQEKLARMRLRLPPDLLRVPAEGRDDGRPDESLTERLERQRVEEAYAERRLQEATDNEARTSILYSRASLLAAGKKIPPQERDAAEAALAEARREVEAAREFFSSVSLARAATGADIRRIREAQAATGADRAPLEERVNDYARQAERVAAAKAELAAAHILAPDSGLIVAVEVRTGDSVHSGQPCFLFRPDGRTVMVRALAGESAARKLAVGQPCRIRLGGPQELGASGAIVALHPDAAANPPAGSARGTVAWIALAVGSPDSPLFTLADDTEATVTVLLREALSPVNAGSALPSSAAPAPSSIAPAGQLPSAAAPLPDAGLESGENPSGEGPAPVREGQARNSPPAPPVVRAGSPAAAGRAALSDAPQAGRQGPLPSLPPLEAPERLTGSPLPDPRNNPSLITPEILDNAAIAPR